MNASNMNKPSQTDWERIDKLTDEEIDTSDIPPLDDWFFAKARLRMPQQQAPLIMGVDADLLDDLLKAPGIIIAALETCAERVKEHQR
jgi:hypothetical protein